MSDYLHEALSCAFDESDCWDVWHGIGHDKQMEIAKSIQVSVEMESEISSYRHPNASDMIASRERELKTYHHREMTDLDDRRQAEIDELKRYVTRLENRIYELRANAN